MGGKNVTKRFKLRHLVENLESMLGSEARFLQRNPEFRSDVAFRRDVFRFAGLLASRLRESEHLQQKRGVNPYDLISVADKALFDLKNGNLLPKEHQPLVTPRKDAAHYDKLFSHLPTIAEFVAGKEFAEQVRKTLELRERLKERFKGDFDKPL